MNEVYRLDGTALPTLITPHDCIIKEIKKEDDYLILIFEDDISYHDSIKCCRPAAKSLIIKYHLTDNYDIYYQRWNKLKKRLEYIELKDERRLFNNDSEYLYQYVMYNQLIVKLDKNREYMLFLTVDCVEYDWIE